MRAAILTNFEASRRPDGDLPDKSASKPNNNGYVERLILLALVFLMLASVFDKPNKQ